MGFFSNTNPQERAVNDQIQQTHNQINELYMDLGRHVKLNLKDQIDDQYVKNTCQNIDDCLARLQQLNTNLNTLRGIKLCTNCQAQIPVAVTFCPSCGTKQPDISPMNNMNNMNGMGGMNGMNGMNGMGGMNNGMNTMNGGMGGGFVQPAPVNSFAQPDNSTFNPTSAGNSPSNPNKNMVPGANGGFARPQPQSAPVPPVPPMPDVPPVPPMPDVPPVPPVPEAVKPEQPAPEAPAAEEKAPQEPIPVKEVTNEAAEAQAVISETKPEADPVTQAPAAAEFIFCSQCGHKEAANVAFCSQCGSKL